VEEKNWWTTGISEKLMCIGEKELTNKNLMCIGKSVDK
jgi:hypothetical protein